MMSTGSDFRPRRSCLYMPGANTRALEKGRGLPADSLILDLEDAVAAVGGEDARLHAAAVVAGVVGDAIVGDPQVVGIGADGRDQVAGSGGRARTRQV